MCIFKDITNRYCEKILDAYQLQSDEKTYKGKEAGLLIQRNDFARCLVKRIKTIEVKDNDYINYFKEITNEINSALKEVANAVQNIILNLVQHSPSIFMKIFIPA